MADIPEDAFVMINAVSRSLRTVVDRRLTAHGVYVGQQSILACLWDKDGLTPGQLARRLSLETPTVTRTVQRMEASGLVRRADDESDGRLVRVWLTNHGHSLRQIVPRTLAQVRREVFAELSVKDQTVLAELLSRIKVPSAAAE